MRANEVEELLEGMRAGDVSIDDALRALRRLPVEDLGFARLDTHRELRQGLPEAVYAEGKTPEQTVAIAARLLDATSAPVLVTRTPPATADALRERFPDAAWHETARLVVLRGDAGRFARCGPVAVVAAGTSDLPVAEEAACTAGALGAEVDRIADVGVAGLHRLLAVEDRLHDAAVVIVVAGMEGALASAVGGITAAPVVAVPTSVGYGASFGGLAALLAMLNSCAAGITVTNVDNGFGAGVAAVRLLAKMHR
ncbi:MAG TPA: nickel pincer cofactor biosynthesis protein LarB [Actinomycetota bacterium]|nr:nickel pincer cofactor biosynthesis protein LarB [Actinomycetota bacterium]